MVRATLVVLAITAALTLAACGGGGGGGTPATPSPGAPTITATPASISVTEGESASFSVAASGTGPLAYQWRRNGQPISGATQSTLTLASTAFYEGGDRFSVVVSNASAQVSSADATLTVNIRPKLALCATAFIVRADGALWSWGSNTFGALGRGLSDPASVPAPAQVTTLSNVVDVACGGSHALALLRDGSVRAWGLNAYGQLGDGTRTSRSTPVSVTGLTDVVAIGAGEFGSYALRRDGTLWRTGAVEGQFPPPAPSTPVQAPQPVAAPEPLIRMAAANGSSQDALLLVGRSGQLYFYGQDRADSSAGFARPKPVTPVSGVTDAVGLGVGFAANSVLRTDGSVWVWGSGLGGQLGNGSTGNTVAFTPQRVPGLPVVRALSHRSGHLLAVDADHRIWSWGENSYGELGRTTNLNVVVEQATATRVALPLDVEAAVAGRVANSMAMTRDGRIWVWGYNFSGTLGTPYPQTISDAVPRVINGVTGR